MPVKFYCGVNETKWNHHPVAPGAFACIAPVYGRTIRTKKENRISVPCSTSIIQDSGAFSDGSGERLSFPDALKRQIAHATKYRYFDQVDAVASYDLLIDEKWIEGRRHKMRWTEGQAEQAISETVAAARYLSQHRCILPHGSALILSVQGVTSEQYLNCTKHVIQYMDLERDILGLGGWCIIGKKPRQMLPVFYDIIRRVIPYASACGVNRVHIWGVIYAQALGPLLWICNQYGIELSTDSAGPSVRPAAFGEWGYADWRDNSYEKAPVEIRGLDRARHVRLTREWLNNLEATDYYYEPPVIPRQLNLL